MEQDGSVADLMPGQSAVGEAGVMHWHGAAPGHCTSHVAVHHGPVTWGSEVSDADDLRGPA